MVLNSNNVILVLWIMLFEIIKDFKFYSSLMMEALFVSNNLKSYIRPCFIVITLKCLTKTTFA